LHAITRDGRAVLYAVYVPLFVVVSDYCTSTIHIQIQGKYPSITTLFVEKVYYNIFRLTYKSHHQADKLLKKRCQVEHFISFYAVYV